MKTKNLYYHAVFKRTNIVKLTFLSFFLFISSWPKTLIETFTRKNQGRRYNLLALNLMIAGYLSYAPFMRVHLVADFRPSMLDLSFSEVISHNLTWYAYIIAYVVYSIKRHLEVRENHGVFDFEHFSLYSGDIHPFFYKIRVFGIEPTRRIISIYYEPGLFFLIGLLLVNFNQGIGYELIVCSIIYSLSWAGQYYLGDQFIMDKIDEMIANGELVDSFVNNLPPEETKGFEAYGSKPRSMDLRRRLADTMIEHEPAADVI